MIDIREMSEESGNGATIGNHNSLSLHKRGVREAKDYHQLTTHE